MSITDAIYSEAGDPKLLVVAVILYSFAWKRGQRNHKYWQGVYKRNAASKKYKPRSKRR